MPLSDAQVVAAFGDPTPYVRPDGSIDDAWATAQLATCELPAPLALSWAPAQLVSRLKVHRRLVGAYTAALGTVRANPDAWAALHTTGGAYCWRPQRQSAGRKLSRHCWGIAIDLDVAENEMGTAGHMHPAVIAAFAAAGFEWGGAWRTRRDPMHFEFGDLSRLP